MKLSPLVTIVTITLNSERTIRRTMESVLRQDYDPLEYVIIDGLSTDGTLTAVREIEPLFAGRLRVVSERDRSAYDGMNKGLRLANGEIIGILNSDDWYLPRAVETVVSRFLSDVSVDVVYGNVLRVLRVGRRTHTIIGRARPAASLGTDMAILHPASFVRQRCYAQWGLFDSRYVICADYELMMRFWKKGARFSYVDDQFTFYSAGGLSANVSLSLREFRRIQRTYGPRLRADAIFVWKSIRSLIIREGAFQRPFTLLRTLLWRLRGVLVTSEPEKTRE